MPPNLPRALRKGAVSSVYLYLFEVLEKQLTSTPSASWETLPQWRNSYGLRVGKPAGTRAEGAPAGCPLTLVFQQRLPFQKGTPFQHFFS